VSCKTEELEWLSSVSITSFDGWERREKEAEVNAFTLAASRDQTGNNFLYKLPPSPVKRVETTKKPIILSGPKRFSPTRCCSVLIASQLAGTDVLYVHRKRFQKSLKGQLKIIREYINTRADTLWSSLLIVIMFIKSLNYQLMDTD